MKKAAVITNVTENNGTYEVTYKSGIVRTYKKITKTIQAWLDTKTKKMVTDFLGISPDASDEEIRNYAYYLWLQDVRKCEFSFASFVHS